MSRMPPDTVASTQMAYYEVLDNPDLSPLGQLLRLLRHPESVYAVLVLRDPQTRELVSVKIVSITDDPDHERQRGAVFFGGTLEDGRPIQVTVYATPQGEDREVLGSAAIYDN